MEQYFKTNIKSYFGGKGSTYRHIINQVPPHEIKICGFLGNCAIMRYMKPAKKNIGFELDRDILSKWENSKNIDRRLELVYGDFLKEPIIFHTQTLETFIYLDPPYMQETRSSSTKYKFELSKDQHMALLDKIKKLPAYVAISHYPCPLYNDQLKKWRYIEYDSQTRSGKNRKERLYMNYTEPEELHDYSFFGKDYREREAIKRRMKTKLKRVEKLNQLERHKFFELLIKRYPTAFNGDVAGNTAA